MTRRCSPLPKLRVTYLTRVPSRPHSPHRRGTLFDPGSDEDGVPRGADLDDAARRLARKRLASDEGKGRTNSFSSQTKLLTAGGTRSFVCTEA